MIMICILQVLKDRSLLWSYSVNKVLSINRASRWDCSLLDTCTKCILHIQIQAAPMGI